ncbi:restriction endonuclease subunit S [Streptomyces sp. NPDC007896]|uniref:restriction endonuclease subunit S n=1 Tax=Streptomyces sp. NPDC007896 TaxID=3364784 RepID=UPI0036EDB6F8
MTNYPERPLSYVLIPTSNTVKVFEGEQYDTAGIYSYARGLFRKPAIDGTETKYRQFNTLRQGQIVYSKLFGWEGAIAYVTSEFDGLHVSHEFPTYEIDEDRADPRYMRHVIAWPTFHASLNKEASGMGSRRQRVNPERFLGSKIPLPSLGEQRRVAKKLDAIMSLITQVATLRDNSSRLAHQYMNSLLRPIEDQEPLSVALHPSSDFVDVEPDENYRTAGILNRGRGLFHRPVISGSDTKYARYNRLRTGQFVYSKLFGWEGSLAVVPTEFEGVHVSHEFPTFDIDTSVADIEYMTHLARWSGLHDALKGKGTGMGSRRQRVNVDRLLATTVPLPGLPEQRRIARQLTVVRRTTEAGAEQTAQVAALRPALLNAAFSGQL